MPDLSAKTGFVYCPSCGRTYDARKNSSCPHCGAGKKGDFGPTGNPYDHNNAGVTKPPSDVWGGSSDPSDQFDPTKPIGEKDTSDIAGSAVVGWLVAVSGPRKGEDYRIHNGYNYIGREEGDIVITGDISISRRRDSAVVFDDGSNQYFVGHAEGQNMLRLNGSLVINSAELHNYDRIKIGTTELVFVGLCGDQFSWERENG